MDPLAIQAAQASLLRIKLAEGAEPGTVTRLGEAVGLGGLAAAGAGFGGHELAKHEAGLAGLGGVEARIAGRDALGWAKGLFTGKPPAARPWYPTGRLDWTRLGLRSGKKLGLGGLAAAAVGVPLYLAGRSADHANAQIAPPSPQMPQAKPDLSARQVTKERLTDTAKSGLSAWWERMKARYGGGA